MSIPVNFIEAMKVKTTNLKKGNVVKLKNISDTFVVLFVRQLDIEIGGVNVKYEGLHAFSKLTGGNVQKLKDYGHVVDLDEYIVKNGIESIEIVHDNVNDLRFKEVKRLVA